MAQAGQQPVAGQAAGQPRQLIPQQIPLVWPRRRQGLGRPPQQGGDGQKPLATRVARIGQGIQQPLQGRGGITGKHVAAAHQPAGQLAPFQGTAQLFGLAVLGHQQTEIGRRQLALLPAIATMAIATIASTDPQRPLQQLQTETSH